MQTRIDHKRIEWDELFMGMCYLIAKRSPDAQTQMGSLIVDQNHHIISMGFNGFPKGFKDDEIPNIRPYKYDYIIHSELNCLLNTDRDVTGCTLYCNGVCCKECIKASIQKGIKEIVMGQNLFSQAGEQKEISDWLIAKSNITVREYRGKDWSFLNDNTK